MPAVIDYYARIDSGDREYHYIVRPGSDVPDSTLEIVYHEHGADHTTICADDDTALAIAQSITRLVELRRARD